jgi:hypothetical protein
MNFIWGLFEKRIADMRMDEKVFLLLIILACFCLVSYAMSLIVQIVRKMDQHESPEQQAQVSLRAGLLNSEALRHYDGPRYGHTD